MNKMKKYLGLAVFGLALVATAAFTMLPVTTYPVARNIPFYTSNVAFDSTTGSQPGGFVRLAVADDSLKIGDVVYWSGQSAVTKSATLVKYDSLAGVVVGGTKQQLGASIAKADVGTLAAAPNERVWVLSQGRTWVPNDANGTLVTGSSVIPSNATAGAVEIRTTAIDTFYRVIGKVITGGLASTTVLISVNVK